MSKKSHIKNDAIVAVIEKIAELDTKNKIQKSFLKAFNSSIIDEKFLNKTLDNKGVIENIPDISNQIKVIPDLNKEAWDGVKFRLLGKRIAHVIKSIPKPNEIQKDFLQSFENNALSDEFLKINYVSLLQENIQENLTQAVLDVEDIKNPPKDWWKKFI